jgi:hypothetical protein
VAEFFDAVWQLLDYIAGLTRPLKPDGVSEEQSGHDEQYRRHDYFNGFSQDRAVLL